ncbi:MAG: xanthine dehydrogenase family protein molybdopterin-binding subunit [Myxococcota bacterium]
MSHTEKLTLGSAPSLSEVEVEVPGDQPRPWDAKAELHQVGQPLARVDGADKLRGAARYTTDVRLPGMLYADVLRSPHAKAKITKLSAQRAATLPGVRAVHALAKVGDLLSFEGQEIVAIAADTPQLAADAVRAVEIEFSVLPSVTALEEAMKPGAPVVHAERSSNLSGPSAGRAKPRGNVEAGLKAAKQSVDLLFRTQVQTHSCLEPHGAVVAPTAEGGFEVWCSTQSIASVVSDVAEAMKVPSAKVRVHCEFIGGGFGSKFGAGAETLIAAELAKKAQKPVRFILDRRGEHLAGGNRPSSRQRVRLGATAEGKLTALSIENHGSAGVGTGAGVTGFYDAIYEAENAAFADYEVATNAGAAAAFRAPGHPQACFALESALDVLAEKLGMDPIALRLANDPHPVRRAEWAEAKQRFDWDARRKAGPLRQGPWRRGIGAAASVWYNIVEARVGATVEINNDGSVVLLSGVQDIGGGIRTVITQVVAEVLGLEISAITTRIGDSIYPVGPGSGGSKTTASLTPAVHQAAEQARQKLAEVVAKLQGAKPSEIRFERGQILGPKGALSFAAAASKIQSGKLVGHGERGADLVGLTESKNQAERALGRLIAGVQMAEVAVDVETGVIQVERILVVQDCGRVMNPLLARSQVNGGVVQGLSYALFEERRLDPKTGRMLHPNLEGYRITGTKDLPAIEVVFHEVYSGRSSTGAMGLGEPATVPTAAAIANAVAHAIGKRVFELPMSPERVLAALRRPV